MLLFAQFINKVNLFANIILPADVSFMQPLRAFLSPTWWTIFTGSIINCKTLQCNYIITFPSNTWNYWIIVLQGYTRSLPLKHQRWELLGIECVCVCVCVRPGNLASLGKRSIVTVFVHLAETMKRIFVSLSRYWRKRYINDGN